MTTAVSESYPFGSVKSLSSHFFRPNPPKSTFHRHGFFYIGCIFKDFSTWGPSPGNRRFEYRISNKECRSKKLFCFFNTSTFIIACSVFCSSIPYRIMPIVFELKNSTDKGDQPESQDDNTGNFVHQRQFPSADFITKNACRTA
jgi:hypothetical protein